MAQLVTAAHTRGIHNAECTTTTDLFPACKSRKIEVDFEEGDITSDAGILLPRQVDRKIGLKLLKIGAVVTRNTRLKQTALPIPHGTC